MLNCLTLNGTTVATAATSSLLQAWEQGSLGVSFGVAGFLVGYLAGVAYMLAELGIITPDTKIAGASSGALITMGLCVGLTPEQFMHTTQELSDRCRRQSNCQGTLGAALRETLLKFVPPEAYKRCSNKAFLSISLGKFPNPQRENLLVGTYSNSADLIAAGQASAYIPVWSGSAPDMNFRGGLAHDGFFSNSQPCPPGLKRCINVNSRNPPWDNKQLGKFFGVVARTASAGPLRPARLINSPPGGWPKPPKEAGAAPAAALQQAAALGVDIAPGIYSSTGIPDTTWDEMVVLPGDAATNRHLYQLGRQDAQAWARLTGLEAAAAAKRSASKATVVTERGREQQQQQHP